MTYNENELGQEGLIKELSLVLQQWEKKVAGGVKNSIRVYLGDVLKHMQ